MAAWKKFRTMDEDILLNEKLGDYEACDSDRPKIKGVEYL